MKKPLLKHLLIPGQFSPIDVWAAQDTLMCSRPKTGAVMRVSPVAKALGAFHVGEPS